MQSPISCKEFKYATQDKLFFDLLQKHIGVSKNISFAMASLQGTLNLLPDAVKERAEEILSILPTSELIKMNCADVFRQVEISYQAYFPLHISEDNIFNMFNAYILLLVCHAFGDNGFKKSLGARYGTFFLTKIIYNMALKKKYFSRFGAFVRFRQNGMTETEAMEHVNKLYQPTVADDIYFEKMRLN